MSGSSSVQYRQQQLYQLSFLLFCIVTFPSTIPTKIKGRKSQVCVLFTSVCPMLRKLENTRERHLKGSHLGEMEALDFSGLGEKQDPLWEVVPLPHGETVQAGLRQRWGATALPSSDQLPNLEQKSKWKQGRDYDTVIRQGKVKSIAWGQVMSLHNDERCNPQCRSYCHDLLGIKQ